MNLAFDSLQKKTIQQILEWYNFEVEVLGREKVRVLSESLRSIVPQDSRFFGLTGEEIEIFFRLHKNELDFLTMLDLMSAAEAAIQLNYLDRLARRLKDPVSKRFKKIQRNMSKRKGGERTRLEEHILDTWIELVPGAARPAREFKSALKLRHWLAHGRYWDTRLARTQYFPGRHLRYFT